MIKQKDGYILRSIMDEYMLFPVGTKMQEFKGTILMNELAVFIWRNLQIPSDKETLVAEVLKQYDVEKGQVEVDVENILDIFSSYGIVEEIELSGCTDCSTIK